jgi:phosphoserine phosphatase
MKLQRFVVVLFGRTVCAAHVERVSALLAAHALALEPPRPPVPGLPATYVELHAEGPPAAEASLRAALLSAADQLSIDIAFRRREAHGLPYRLCAFDMDSTLIAGEGIDELAAMAGAGGQVAAITAAAMRGELDFSESFRRRVALLRGLPESRALALTESIPLMEGAAELFAGLRRRGIRTAVLSGGFTFFARHLQERLGIDYAFANPLEVRGGMVTGEVTAPIVDGRRKAELLREIAAREGIPLEQTVAVGDGANDLPMLAAAGMGVAFHAKPVVRQAASHAISHLGLDGLLCLLGPPENRE